MILLITALAKAGECARALQQATDESVKVCASMAEAVVELQAQHFSAVIFDQLLLDSDPDEGRSVFKQMGSAAPMYVNFAVCGAQRVVRELRSALQRRKRELVLARQEAQQNLRSELNNTVTSLLLSCEMALHVPDLPAFAQTKMQDVEALARQISVKLGAMA